MELTTGSRCIYTGVYMTLASLAVIRHSFSPTSLIAGEISAALCRAPISQPTLRGCRIVREALMTVDIAHPAAGFVGFNLGIRRGRGRRERCAEIGHDTRTPHSQIPLLAATASWLHQGSGATEAYSS